ncbi:protein EFR3 homolog A [Leptonychotes weddellii]|uniref:Protein EFR3 homolog A n=1 Tax=Leptonychotes weddellii TaxID=9713 RepID=A0A7F8Q7Y7_LEPWE|nr:protein EFR3 homolog A [Leptonychotes weddellii]
MEKLTFYAVSAPEKLDRIGSYLAERLSRDVVRHRSGYVLIAMEALDQLLMACHSQSIKPFVESFLHMVAKLLESGEPKLQVLGTNSCIWKIKKTWKSKQDTCNSNIRKIRIAGIRGIQGVVRKTVNDELRATIWEPQHMDKIVPSLLFNMQKIEEVDSRTGPPPSPSAADKEENPAVLAENCFRELLGRATFGNMNNAVRPVFACLFTGPTVLEVFNTLLKHLRLSVEFEANDLQGGSVGSTNLNSSSKDNDEKIVQNAIIQTIVFVNIYIDTSGTEEQEKEKRRLVIEKFQKAPFEEIAAQCESKANLLHDRLAQILELTIRPPPSPSGTLTITSGHAQYQSIPVYEMKFPDLCVY